MTVRTEETVLLFKVVLMAAAVPVVHVCMQQDQYPCYCCQDRITRGSDPLDRGRIYEELSGSPTATTGGKIGGLVVVCLAFM